MSEGRIAVALPSRETFTLQKTGAVARIEEMIAGFTSDAERALAAADIEDDAADGLRALADAAIARSA